jgi:esterase/lipase
LHSRFFAFRNYAVLVPDLPGHTHSEGPPLE